MKAWHIMMFLLLFNMGVSLVSTLHIYALPVEEYKGNQFSTTVDTSSTPSPMKTLQNFGITFGATFLDSLLVGALASLFTRIPAVTVIAYSVFIQFFWIFAYNSFSTLWNIANWNGHINPGIAAVVYILAFIVGIIFVVGMMQMLTGGWKSYE